ncbi:hypothetical protein BS78_10G098100 [Paspalum vaginatum]|nr:hypothetical protein BS78_10G098100 [Paspalum vaginatum]
MGEDGRRRRGSCRGSSRRRWRSPTEASVTVDPAHGGLVIGGSRPDRQRTSLHHRVVADLPPPSPSGGRSGPGRQKIETATTGEREGRRAGGEKKTMPIGLARRGVGGEGGGVSSVAGRRGEQRKKTVGRWWNKLIVLGRQSEDV